MDFSAKLSEADVIEMLGRQIRLEMIAKIVKSDNEDGAKIALIEALIEG